MLSEYFGGVDASLEYGSAAWLEKMSSHAEKGSEKGSEKAATDGVRKQ